MNDKIIPYKLMLDILSRHDIYYKIIDSKGLIDYDNLIYINPIYNEDCKTLYHELLHYKSDMIDGSNLPEDEIERQTISDFETNKGLEKFLSEYLERYVNE